MYWWSCPTEYELFCFLEVISKSITIEKVSEGFNKLHWNKTSLISLIYFWQHNLALIESILLKLPGREGGQRVLPKNHTKVWYYDYNGTKLGTWDFASSTASTRANPLQKPYRVVAETQYRPFTSAPERRCKVSPLQSRRLVPQGGRSFSSVTQSSSRLSTDPFFPKRLSRTHTQKIPKSSMVEYNADRYVIDHIIRPW